VTFRLILALLLALCATVAHAQAARDSDGTTVFPVFLNNGQLEGLLLLDPSPMPQLPSQRVIRPAQPRPMFSFGALQLRAGFSVDGRSGYGLLCDNAGTVITSVGSLAGHCLLADLNGTRAPIVPGRATGVLQLRRNDKSLSASVGTNRTLLGITPVLPGSFASDQRLLDNMLGPAAAGIDEQNASLVGQVNVGAQGWITIGGTLARARLIPASQLPGGVPSEWTTSSLSVGAGSRRLGGEITGQVIEVPGQPQRFSTLGAGVTWRTPWRAKVSVGAENLLTRGKNPFLGPDSRSAEEDDEGRVPFVRYQQDL
jgi:hypothetical protein